MRKLLVLFLICWLPSIAATNYGLPQIIGFVPTNGTSTTDALSTAANAGWWAFSYIPPVALTLQNVSSEVSAVGGTLGANDVTVDVYSDLGGGASKPNASLASSNVSSSQSPGFISFGGSGSGYNFALTAGTLYWFVIKNTNGTPGTNFPTIRYGSGNSFSPSQNNSTCFSCSWMIATTVNSGTSWSVVNGQIPFVRLDFTDGSTAGFPVINIAADTTSTVYSAREVGNQFVSPPVQVNVRAIQMNITRSASAPTQGFRFGLWNCTGGTTCTNLGYTATGLEANVATGSGSMTLYFATPVALPPNATIHVTAGEVSNADASTNNYRLMGATWDSNALSLGLKQLGGTTTLGAYCTGTCTTYSNWSFSTTTVYGIGFLLVSSGEFTATTTPVSSPIAQ